MKTILVTLFALFLGVQFLAAQDTKATQQAQPATQTIQPQPVQQAQPTQPAVPKNLTWNETTHDFGTIVQNDPAEVTFTFKNTGTEPLVMTAARSSCGCTVAEYTKEPVKPGGTGTVKATYNSAKPGNFMKTVSVTFEGNPTPDVLTIKGVVEAKPATTTTP